MAEIYNTDDFILIRFKLNENDKINNIQYIYDKDINDVIQFVGSLSINNITSELYTQKDIKGFEENSFYIIKTKEHSNWHPAIARIDLNEFASEIIKLDIGEELNDE